MSKFALLIGVSEYSEGENPLSALPAALNDVRTLSVVLEDSNIGEFDEVTVLENPSAGQIRSKIEALFADRSADDLVLLYFSGHGITDQQGNFFFSTPKTYKNQKGFLVKSSAVPAQEVHGYMDDCASDRMVVILDCCHSGAFGDLILRDAGEIKFEPQLGGRGRVVLTASSAIDYSYERSGEELAVYTRYLIEGIESGAADFDEDGYVSADELHEYVVGKLEKAAPGMSPQRYVRQDGEKIRLTKAIVADPTRQYRKAVRKYSRGGIIRAAGKRNLDSVRMDLGLDEVEAFEILEDELRPYREYDKHLREYEEDFRSELDPCFGLDDRGREELNDLIDRWKLKPSDVEKIEKRVIHELDDESPFLKQTNSQIVTPAKCSATSKEKDNRDLTTLWQEILANIEEAPDRAVLQSACCIIELNGTDVKIGVFQQYSLSIVKARSSQLGKACAKVLKRSVKMSITAIQK